VFEEGLVGVRGLKDGREEKYDDKKKEREGSGRKGELNLATSDGSKTEGNEGDGSKNEEEVVFVEVKKVWCERKKEKGNKESGQREDGPKDESSYFVECFPHIIILMIYDPVVKANIVVKRFVGTNSK